MVERSLAEGSEWAEYELGEEVWVEHTWPGKSGSGGGWYRSVVKGFLADGRVKVLAEDGKKYNVCKNKVQRMGAKAFAGFQGECDMFTMKSRTGVGEGDGGVRVELPGGEERTTLRERSELKLYQGVSAKYAKRR